MKATTRYQKTAILVFLFCSIGACITTIITGSSTNMYAIVIYNIMNVFLTPLLALALGAVFSSSDSSDLIYSAFGFIVLFYVQKVLYFWVKTAMGSCSVIDLIHGSELSWIFICIAGWLLLTDGIHILMKRFHLPVIPVFILLICIAALSGFFFKRTILSFGKIISFFPLFFGSYLYGKNSEHKIKQRHLLFFISAAGILCSLALIWLKPTVFKKAAGLFNAGSAYQHMFPNHVMIAPVFRLGQLFLGLCLFYALMYIFSMIRISFEHVYAPALNLCFYGRMLTFISAQLSHSFGRKIGLVVFLVLAVLFSLPLLSRPVRALMALPKRMAENRISPKRMPLIYFFFCLLLISAIWSYFAGQGFSMIWSTDGSSQYYHMLSYTRKYILTFFGTLFSTGKIVLPQWDFSIGQGGSVLSIIRLTPYTLITLFIPETYLPEFYSLVVLLQFFFIALAARYFCRCIGLNDELAVMTGSFVYAFCGYALFANTKHIFFGTYLLLALPLLLSACERWLQKKKWGFFVFIIFSLFLSGYYYTWMNSLFMAVYLFVRCVVKHKTNIKAYFKDLLPLIGFYLIGLGLAAFVFIPSVTRLSTSSRLNLRSNTNLDIFYQIKYYQDILAKSFGGNPNYQTWTRLSFASIAFFALIAIFFHQKDKKYSPALRILTVFSGFALTFPVVGFVFNGTSYVSGRFTYGISFFLGVLISYTFPKLHSLTRRQLIITCTVSLAYVIFAMKIVRKGEKELFPWMLLLLIEALIILYASLSRRKNSARLCLYFSVFVALTLNINHYYSPDAMNGASTFISDETMRDRSTASAEYDATIEEPGSLYRSEVASNKNNSFILTGGNGTSRYASIMDSLVTEYFLNFDLNTVNKTYQLEGLDNRTSLCALASVKYVVHPNKKIRPYGYKKVKTDEEAGMNIYENQYYLPFGYTYTSCMTQKEFESLEPLDRQQAIMQCAVLSESEDTDFSMPDGLTSKTPEITTQKVDYQITDTHNVTLGQNSFEVTKSDTRKEDGYNGSMTLTFDGIEDCETYLYIKGLTFTSSESKSAIHVIGAGNVRKAGTVYAAKSAYLFDRDGYTFNLGYTEEKQTTITLTFENKGTYSYDDIEIVCLPMEEYRTDVEKLRETVLENVTEDTNGLSGTITTPDERLMVLSIPYNDGWTIQVDGKDTEYLRVNTMYTGVMLTKGTHTIKVTYQIPGLLKGLCISLASLLILIVTAILLHVRRRRVKKL